VFDDTVSSPRTNDANATDRETVRDIVNSFLLASGTERADYTSVTGRPGARSAALFLGWLTGLIVVTSTIGIINPLLIQAVFNNALFVPGGPNLQLLVILVAIMAVVPVVNGAIGILQTYETTRVGQQVMRDLRDRLYAHLQTLSLAFFTSTKTGEIQSRLANDVGGVQSVL
jgi:ABC-type multidrug transport system fused ATPase/permease subunit